MGRDAPFPRSPYHTRAAEQGQRVPASIGMGMAKAQVKREKAKIEEVGRRDEVEPLRCELGYVGWGQAAERNAGGACPDAHAGSYHQEAGARPSNPTTFLRVVACLSRDGFPLAPESDV